MQETSPKPATLGDLAGRLRQSGLLPEGDHGATHIIAYYSQQEVRSGIAQTEGNIAYHTVRADRLGKMTAGDSPELEGAELAKGRQLQEESEIALRRLGPEAELAEMVRGRYSQFSRRDRIACLIAGGALGLGVAAGIVATHPWPRPQSAEYAVMTAQEQQDIKNKQTEAVVATGASAIALALGLIAGYGVGQKAGPSFARRRARAALSLTY